MSRLVDSSKRAVWRERLRRFSASGLPVEKFCKREGVSTASFYGWKKKLKHEPAAPRASDAGASRGQAFRPVTVIPATAGVSIHLPGGTRIEVRSDEPEAIRAVLAEVMRPVEQWAKEATC